MYVLFIFARMVNENLGSLDGIDSWEIRQNANKVTEEAVQRIQAQQKKAQQIQGEIKKDKAVKDHLARFLAFLLKDIKQDSLVQQIYTVFFHVKHPKQDITYVRKTINAPLLVWIFAPFYQERLAEFHLETYYQIPENVLDIKQYLSYLKQLSVSFHDNIPIDKSSLLDFLVHLFVYYQLITDEGVLQNKEKHQERVQKIEKSLY